MKKIFTLVLCVLAAFTANAQIEVLDNGKAAANGSTIEVHGIEENWGTPDAPFYMLEFEQNPFIYNKGNKEVTVTLTVTKSDIADALSWCIGGSCKPFDGISLTQSMTFKAGAKENLELHPLNWEIGKARSQVAKLEVKANGQTQKFTIKFIYNPVPAGIEGNVADRMTVANKQFTYNFSSNADRVFNVYGVSGRMVKSVALAQNGSVSLNDLQHGVYIYEVKTNGKRTAAHKFVVR